MWCVCFSPKGPGNRVNGTMKYYYIINLNLAVYDRKLKLDCRWIFQLDIDPKYMSKSIHKWLTEHKICFLPQPSQSSDLNPFENLQAEFKRRAHKIGPRTLGDLERNALRLLALYSPTLIDGFTVKGRLYKALNIRVPPVSL